MLTYGIDSNADIRAADIRDEGWGVRFALTTPRAVAEVYLPKPGRFNVHNALAAVAIGLSAGLPLRRHRRGFEDVAGRAGTDGADRFSGQPFRVVVDFAHAPESLRRVLRLLRETSPGRVVVVFGAIGERDKEQRPGMARAAAEIADYTFVTDDNPYTEDRDAIFRATSRGRCARRGSVKATTSALCQTEREAISQAISMAVDEDSILLAGQGPRAGSASPAGRLRVRRPGRGEARSASESGYNGAAN